MSQKHCENHDCKDEELPFGLQSLLHNRYAPSQQGLRAVQFAILSSMRDSGHLPTKDNIDSIAAEYGKTGDEVLRVLHEQDYVRIDQHGKIIVAYPFSIKPTRHRVELQSGVTVFAMCAIHALGMPRMIHGDANIHSKTGSGDEVCIIFRQQQVSWDPTEAVVFVGMTAPTGAAADVCCSHVNFFVNRTDAGAWIEAHPNIKGTVLGQRGALQLGAAVFGKLLQ